MSLDKFFNMSLDMLCIAGTDGYFKRVNPSFTRVLGYSEEELLSKPFVDFVHPDDVESTAKAMETSLQGDHISDFSNRYLHADGTYRIISWSASTDMEEDLIYAVARDITEQLNISDKLIQLQNALNNETILAVTDAQGTIIEVNEKFCDISGYSREELIGQNHRIINSDCHSKEFFQGLWETISSKNTWSGMIENRRKDGEHYFVHSIITPICNAHGDIINYMAIRFDITDHVHLKDELNKTLDILNETSSIAKVGGWELNIKTGELLWTDETFNILEVEKRENQKPTLPEGLNLFTPECKPIIDDAVNRAIEFGEPYSLELKAQTAKGNVLWVYTNGKANYENGEIVSLSGTIQDIQAQKIAEEKYMHERQKSIQNAKLASLGEMAAGIAHEINNPLSIIDGSTQIISQRLNDAEALQPKIDNIRKSCKRISRIVKSLKKFSHTSEHRNLSPNCLADIVKEALILTEIKSKKSNINITFKCDSEALINCDDVEIEQVIVNLINNSIDAIKNQAEKWCTLTLYEEDTFIVLKITDSGTGISPGIEEKLFDPFFTTKKTGEGTGLGLSITKGILDDHNASISIDRNSPNTCFVIKFNKQG